MRNTTKALQRWVLAALLIALAPAPASPQALPYTTQALSYHPEAHVTLAGTLTLPRGRGPFPAVLLLTGSGPQDRDSSWGSHRPFKVLADAFARRGIATLRMDDRGVGGSSGSTEQSTMADCATDALAGVACLGRRKEIDAKRIGLIGHSGGGLVAALAAARSADVSFIVMMASPGKPGEANINEQTAARWRKRGAPESEIAYQIAEQNKIFALLREPTVSREKLRQIIAPLMARGRSAPPSEESVEQIIDAHLRPEYRFFLTYDPGPTLAKVSCPILAINGDADVQVPGKENLRAIAKTLVESGHTDFAVRELVHTNHVFQTCRTGLPEEYFEIEDTMSRASVKAIGDWVSSRTMP